MIRDQPPAPFLLNPYARKTSVARHRLDFVLPIHGRASGLHSRISVEPHPNFVGGYGLKFQLARREVFNHLRLCSHCAAWPYAEKISRVEPIEGNCIST